MEALKLIGSILTACMGLLASYYYCKGDYDHVSALCLLVIVYEVIAKAGDNSLSQPDKNVSPRQEVSE